MSALASGFGGPKLILVLEKQKFQGPRTNYAILGPVEASTFNFHAIFELFVLILSRSMQQRYFNMLISFLLLIHDLKVPHRLMPVTELILWLGQLNGLGHCNRNLKSLRPIVCFSSFKMFLKSSYEPFQTMFYCCKTSQAAYTWNFKIVSFLPG